MTLCLLARHAAHELVDRVLVGRTPGLPLSEKGRQQAFGLRRRLQTLGFTRVQSSPRQRAVETAEIIAEGTGIEVEVCAALDELDFGAWTGRTFEDLATEPRWARWNNERGSTRPPGGEDMEEAQARIVAHLRLLHERYPKGRIAIVTHAEIIRAAVLHAMSLPLDNWWGIEVAPASITRLDMRSRTHSIVSPGLGTAAA